MTKPNALNLFPQQAPSVKTDGKYLSCPRCGHCDMRRVPHDSVELDHGGVRVRLWCGVCEDDATLDISDSNGLVALTWGAGA
jgi:hypothetical protein